MFKQGFLHNQRYIRYPYAIHSQSEYTLNHAIFDTRGTESAALIVLLFYSGNSEVIRPSSLYKYTRP